MGQQIADRNNPSRQLKVNADGSIDSNLSVDGAVVSSTNPLPVDATIVVSDIQIGAVELKNATDDTRAVIKTDGTNNALVVTQNNQPLPSGAATSAKQLSDNHNVTVSNQPSEFPLPSAQVTTLTPPAAITGFATETTLNKLVGFGVTDDLTITDVTSEGVETITITNGVITKTITITIATGAMSIAWT